MAVVSLPREHGAWAMLAVPWVVGCGIAGRLTLSAVLVLVGALALFLAQHELADWYRSRRRRGSRAAVAPLLVLTVIGLVALAPALRALPLAAVAVLAAAALAAAVVSLRLVDARLDHALPGQALAAVGLALTAPLAYFAGGGARPRTALALWLVNAAYFSWGVFYVNLKIVARARRQPLARPAERVTFAARTLVIDAALAGVVVVALGLGGLPWRALVAFVPAALQTVAGTAALHRPAVLKRVGLMMLTHAIVFAVLFILLA